MYYDFIKSKAIRDYYKENQLPLTQREIASIIYNQSFNVSEILENFRKLYNMVDGDIQRDILTYEKYVKENVELLEDNRSNIIYSVYLDCDCHISPPDIYLNNLSDAMNFGSDKCERWYDITKCIISNNLDTDENCEPISVGFTKDKNVVGFSGSAIIEEEYNRDKDGHNSFTKYFKVQYPFRYGNKVMYQRDDFDNEYLTFDGMTENEYNEYMSKPLNDLEEHHCDLEEYEVYVRTASNVRTRIHPLLLEWDTRKENRNE